MNLNERIKQQNAIIDSVSKVYGIYRSYEVSTSVADYCSDMQIKLDYEEFRRICRLISCKVNVMQPTITDTRHCHNMLLEDLNKPKEKI